MLQIEDHPELLEHLPEPSVDDFKAAEEAGPRIIIRPATELPDTIGDVFSAFN